MPWLVVILGLMIVPLSVTSISFVIIQPIVIGTSGTLTLIAAAASWYRSLYAVDELIASLQFVRRRVRVGQNWLRAFFAGDTDERSADDDGHFRVLADEFDRSPLAVVKDMLVGGVGLPWNLGLSAVIGSSLHFTRLNFGTTGTMANAYHVIGFLVLTTLSIAAAEATRVVRYLNVLFGAALLHYTVPAGCGHGRDDQQHRLWSLSDRAQLPALANPPALRHMAGL